jgi:hypothetical protein
VKNLKLRDIEIQWEKPASEKWQSALYLEDVQGLEIDGFAGRPAWPDRDDAAVVFKNVSDAMIRNSRALEGTKTFLKVSGQESRDIVLDGNDFRKVKFPQQIDKDVKGNAVKEVNNIGP